MSVFLMPARIGPRTERIDGRSVEITEADLRKALARDEAIISKQHAIGLVAASALPDKIELLDSILRDASAPPDLRRTAAVTLGRLDDAKSRQALRSALGTSDARALLGVVKALGWIGEAQDFDRLLALSQAARGILARQAEFAARLIAHRSGLPAADLPALEASEFLDVPAEGQVKIEVSRASQERAQLCLRSVASRTFGVRYDSNETYQLRCSRTEWMLLLESGFSADPPGALQRRAVTAALALWIAENDVYSIASLALFDPFQADPVRRLVLCRTTSDPIMSGHLVPDGQQVRFRLRALARPGAASLLIEGSVQPGHLSIEQAVSGPVAIPKRRPAPFDGLPRGL